MILIYDFPIFLFEKLAIHSLFFKNDKSRFMVFAHEIFWFGSFFTEMAIIFFSKCQAKIIPVLLGMLKNSFML